MIKIQTKVTATELSETLKWKKLEEGIQKEARMEKV